MRSLGSAELRVDEQLHRVVAGLAVDVDGAREVRRAVVVEEVVVGEPAVAHRAIATSSPERG